MMQSAIQSVHAREILDSRGNPTVSVTITLKDGTTGTASVPSGASTGSREAVELRDNDPARFCGKGVRNACENVNSVIAPALLGINVLNQEYVDRTMIELDGSPAKQNLGANAMLGVSLAAARASAECCGLPLYRRLGGINAGGQLPIPMMNVINAGAHSDAPVDFQEFMVCPNAGTFRERLRKGVELFHSLKRTLKQKGFSTAVGDEGGFAPALDSVDGVFECLLKAAEQAGFSVGTEPGKDLFFALDCAASEFYDPKKKLYCYRKSNGIERTSAGQIDFLESLVRQYPIGSIEDGMAESDWEGWRELTKLLGSKIMLVGDDLLVTNTDLLKRAIETKAANAILIKPNQGGTLTETLAAVRTAQTAGFRAIISHRSGETEDSFIADLAAALNTGYLKAGSASRSDRLCKYNRLLQIEEELTGQEELCC